VVASVVLVNEQAFAAVALGLLTLGAAVVGITWVLMFLIALRGAL
jgi:hypothetical protein